MNSLLHGAVIVGLSCGIGTSVWAQSSPEVRMENARQYYEACLASGDCQSGSANRDNVFDPAGRILEDAFTSYLNGIFSIPGQASTRIDTRSVWDIPDPIWAATLDPGSKFWGMGEGTDPNALASEIVTWMKAIGWQPFGGVVRRTRGRYAYSAGSLPPEMQTNVQEGYKDFTPQPPQDLEWLDGTDFLGAVWMTEYALDQARLDWRNSGLQLGAYQSNGQPFRLNVSPYDNADVLADLPAGRHALEEMHCESGSPDVVWCQVVMRGPYGGFYIGWTRAAAYR
ncbi:hypothetical protein [Sagittula stellata]|uniref:hypothetical protein n=1 Tax=Sagittula stellata TaxID=52603 RepID=UPI0012F4C40C|nr:hypothetical protein [Sagittula stellata]